MWIRQRRSRGTVLNTNRREKSFRSGECEATLIRSKGNNCECQRSPPDTHRPTQSYTQIHGYTWAHRRTVIIYLWWLASLQASQSNYEKLDYNVLVRVSELYKTKPPKKLEHTYTPTHPTRSLSRLQTHSAHTNTLLVHTHRDTYTTHRQTHSWDYEWVIALPSRAWGAGDFHTPKKQVTSAQLPYKCMYSAAMYRYSCSVCCKTCKYRTARKNLFFFSPNTCVREEEGGRLREDGVKAIRGH